MDEDMVKKLMQDADRRRVTITTAQRSERLQVNQSFLSTETLPRDAIITNGSGAAFSRSHFARYYDADAAGLTGSPHLD
jgi:hypothetical protein